MPTNNPQPTRDSLFLDPSQSFVCQEQMAPAKASASPLTTGTLWTYTGTIEIIKIIGRVTTVIQSQATTTKLSVVSDALTSYDIDATVDLTGAAVGTLFSITGAAASAALATANGVLAPVQASGSVVATCTISGIIKVTFGAASTGALAWYLLWRPIAVGSTVN